MGSLHLARPPPRRLLPVPYCAANTLKQNLLLKKKMKALLLLFGFLLCLHLSESFSYRGVGALSRNRNRGSNRGYLRNLGGGRSRMGGMGFGKRAYDFYGPEEEPDYYDVLDGVDLDQLTEAERDVLGLEDKGAELGTEAEKRGISSLKGKRGLGGALASLRSRGRGKRGALSSLRNQGFYKYNI